jgi:heme-degrading monooxygenase HmoA
MITEIAGLYIRKEEDMLFEQAFGKAQAYIRSAEGYITHELLKCLEVENKYLLLVRWEKLESHTIGFRQSEAYKTWKILLHGFYDPFPLVEHYKKVF